MGAFAGPEIIEDGLVLALDAGNSKGDDYENLLTYSEQLDNSVWANTGYGTLATVTPNTIIAPNGSLTADTINFAPDATNQSRRMQIVSNMNGTYTVSAHVKKGNMSSISLYVTANQPPYPNINYNFNTDTVSGTGATRTLLSDGWVRISCTATVTTHTGYVGFIGFSTGFTYAWGLQLEKRSSLTNYYTTTNTTKLAGTTWTDLSGNGNNGTLEGAGYNSANGGSLTFDGSNDYIDLTQTIQFNTSDFSISGWFRSNSGNTSYKQIWNSGYNGGTPDVEVGLLTQTNQLYFYIRPPGERIDTTYSVDDNVWRHFTATKTSSVISLYINGALASSASGTYTSDVDTAGVIPRIGNGLNNTNNRPFKGNIAQVSIYNKALTASEIQQNFNATRSRFGI